MCYKLFSLFFFINGSKSILYSNLPHIHNNQQDCSRRNMPAITYDRGVALYVSSSSIKCVKIWVTDSIFQRLMVKYVWLSTCSVPQKRCFWLACHLFTVVTTTARFRKRARTFCCQYCFITTTQRVLQRWELNLLPGYSQLLQWWLGLPVLLKKESYLTNLTNFTLLCWRRLLPSNPGYAEGDFYRLILSHSREGKVEIIRANIYLLFPISQALYVN